MAYQATVDGMPQPHDRLTPRPRRARKPAESRRYDPERSSRRLLAAALEEFAAKGYARATVQDIADRAQLSKQLISYYFGGKEGLYRGVLAQWQQREASFSDPDEPFGNEVAKYLRETLADPRPTRLLIWRALDQSEPVPERPAEDDPGLDALARMRRRQAMGEIAADIDPGALLIVLIAAVAAPVTLPQRISRILGLDPQSAEFAEAYAEQLQRIVGHLAGSDPAGKALQPDLSAVQAAKASLPDKSHS